FGFRMVKGARFGAEQLAKDHDFVADGEVFFHKRQIPPTAMQVRGAVVEHELEDGFGAVAEPFDSERDDLAACKGRLAELQVGDSAKLSPILVAAWPLQEQVLDGPNSQPFQLFCPFRADPAQGSNRPGARRDGLFWRVNSHRFAPYGPQASSSTGKAKRLFACEKPGPNEDQLELVRPRAAQAMFVGPHGQFCHSVKADAGSFGAAAARQHAPDLAAAEICTRAIPTAH